ncbi:hypothetical protein K525DRAFT_272828 [Schizophyllum commune Loenen D]|nr:hypothetical protein K525DRAFT_272828 [Schizophyllum commune Loenen D]
MASQSVNDEPTSFPFHFDLQPLASTDYTAAQHVAMVNKSYARIAHRLGLDRPAQLRWPRPKPTRSENNAPASSGLRQTITERSRPVNLTRGRVLPVLSGRGLPRGTTVRSQQRGQYQQLPVSDTQALVGTRSNVQLVRHEEYSDSQARLLLTAAFGEYYRGTPPNFLNFCVDTADWGWWAYHPAYQVNYDGVDPDDRHGPTVEHQVDGQAPRTIPPGLGGGEHKYMDQEQISYVDAFYFNNIAPVTIETGNIAPNGDAEDIHLRDIKYQLAYSVSLDITDEFGVDGYIGFDPQPIDYERQLSMQERIHARPTLMNQLFYKHLIPRHTKIFVISPSYKRNIQPRMYLGGGGAGWPALLPNPFGRNYRLDPRKEIAIPCFPYGEPERQLSGWYVKLTEINIVGDPRGASTGIVFKVLFRGSCLVLLDTGTEYSLLPEIVFEAIQQPDSIIRAVRERDPSAEDDEPESDEYLYEPANVQGPYWIQLGFAAAFGRPAARILLAPLADAVNHRNT